MFFIHTTRGQRKGIGVRMETEKENNVNKVVQALSLLYDVCLKKQIVPGTTGVCIQAVIVGKENDTRVHTGHFCICSIIGEISRRVL